jgi:hypothetical protein
MTQGVIEARAWLVSLACDKAKDHGYPHELWTTRLLARHARENAPAAPARPAAARRREAEHPHVRADPIRQRLCEGRLHDWF